MKDTYTCIVIGAGPAGLQAAIFLGRANVETLVIGQPEQSDLSLGQVIGNVFGLASEPSGPELLNNAVKQVKRYGSNLVEDEVVDVERPKDIFIITTATQKKFKADFIIIATGQAYEMAGIQNEDKYMGKGVHTCTACDGIFYKGKVVGVIGNGSHAAQEAVELTDFAKTVTIYTQGKKPEWSTKMAKLVKEKDIAVSEDSVTKLVGNAKIKEAELGNGEKVLLDGIFVALGTASTVTFANKLGIVQENTFLVTDREGKTNVDGVWAAGSATGGPAQIAINAGEGAAAAISVIKRAKGTDDYVDQT